MPCPWAASPAHEDQYQPGLRRSKISSPTKPLLLAESFRQGSHSKVDLFILISWCANVSKCRHTVTLPPELSAQPLTAYLLCDCCNSELEELSVLIFLDSIRT